MYFKMAISKQSLINFKCNKCGKDERSCTYKYTNFQISSNIVSISFSRRKPEKRVFVINNLGYTSMSHLVSCNFIIVVSSDDKELSKSFRCSDNKVHNAYGILIFKVAAFSEFVLSLHLDILNLVSEPTLLFPPWVVSRNPSSPSIILLPGPVTLRCTHVII